MKKEDEEIRLRDEYEERAAILEYDSGLSRDVAEYRARVMVYGKGGKRD